VLKRGHLQLWPSTDKRSGKARFILLQIDAVVRWALARIAKRLTKSVIVHLRAIRLAAPTELGDGSGYSTDGGTFFTTLDGRAEEGQSPDSVIPPGDDLIEKELRRYFELEEDEEMNGGKSGEGEEIALMWKLRKELGDEDFAAIFEDPRITGQGPVRRKPGQFG